MVLLQCDLTAKASLGGPMWFTSPILVYLFFRQGLVFVIFSFDNVLCNRNLPSERAKYGIHDNLVRYSFGVEDFEDLKADVLHALEAI